MNNDFLTGKHNTDKGMLLVWCEVSLLQQCVGVIVKTCTSLWKQAVGWVRTSIAEGSRQMMCECNTAACTAWLFAGCKHARRCLCWLSRDLQQRAGKLAFSTVCQTHHRKQLISLSENETLIAGLIAAILMESPLTCIDFLVADNISRPSIQANWSRLGQCGRVAVLSSAAEKYIKRS